MTQIFSVVSWLGYDKILADGGGLGQKFLEDFEATTLDDDESPSTSTQNNAKADRREFFEDSDTTMISDDEENDVIGSESDRSEEEAPDVEDLKFLDDEEIDEGPSSHAALLQSARQEDENQFLSRYIYFHFRIRLRLSYYDQHFFVQNEFKFTHF